MKLLQLILISGFLMVGTAHAAANDGSFNTAERAFTATPLTTQKVTPKRVSLNTSTPQSTRSIRIVREPIPSQNRVIKSTNNRGVVIAPNSISGKMHFITPSKTKAVKASTPNFFPK